MVGRDFGEEQPAERTQHAAEHRDQSGFFGDALVLIAGCAKESVAPKPSASRPSILLVTLDTTRADAIRADTTPSFIALAARGRRFNFAYAAVPQTLPSHLSMLTGLYPAGHGVHENARNFGSDRAVLAEQLAHAGYQTGAFVSAFALAR